MFVVDQDNVAVHFICNTYKFQSSSSPKREFLIYYEWTGSSSGKTIQKILIVKGSVNFNFCILYYLPLFPLFLVRLNSVLALLFGQYV
jgi:hypothetical protein